jgi:DNA polymerase epsilon subunit 1
MNNGTLEFIKFTCEVLGLDSSLKPSALILKRNLLRMIKVREFSEEAQFKNPSLILAIPDVICEFCMNIKDLDLARDSNISQGNWNCEMCNHNYNKVNTFYFMHN